MRLEGLMKSLSSSREFKEIMKSIGKGKIPVGIFGLSESSRSFILGGVYEEIDKPLVIFTHSDVEARNIYEDLC